ncbi:hypothetical protein EGW08_001446 [Elysia chlorotica]|uniref:Sodium-coupled monocarboxylate transporter 1 n=1 Tax=Elysia chlorotica TaxID=188477 RepID=A0A3S1AFW1_ELYCH|nr:hypothetical protein EGW08_001446 [Elysia chlorotica]
MPFSGYHVEFGTADYVVLGMMSFASMAIGISFAFWGKGQGTQADYLLGGRQFKALPVCLSLFASFISAISLIGVPVEVYTYGSMYIYNLIGVIISNIVALFTVVPMMYPLRLTSVYEYLNMRFDSKIVQLFGAAFGVTSTLSYMTLALLSPALALETAVGIPLWLSIILVGAVGTLYTTVGGMKSVIWTDVFQTGIIFAGTFIVIIKGTMTVGGFERVWETNKNSGRIVLDEISFDPRIRHTVWNLIFGNALYWMGHHFSQTSVQRLVSTRSIQDAKKVYMFSILLMIVVNIMLLVTGLVLVSFIYEVGCDPLAAGYIKNRNQLLPYFVIHVLSFLPGLPGLYIATIFSAAMSTFSSGINALAANVARDFIPRYLHRKSEFAKTTITKLLVCFFGIISTGLSYLLKDFEGPVLQIGITIIGATSGPLFGLFLLSGLFPQANCVGTLIGFATALVFSYWQAIGSTLFGFSTDALPMGPTDQCIGGNDSSITVSSVFNFTATYNDKDSFEYTTPIVFGNEQEKDLSILSNRDFSMYDVSYVWIPLTGVFLTVTVGLITSIIANQFSSKVARPKAKFLFPFSRQIWYSERDVVDTEIFNNNIQVLETSKAL